MLRRESISSWEVGGLWELLFEFGFEAVAGLGGALLQRGVEGSNGCKPIVPGAGI